MFHVRGPVEARGHDITVNRMSDINDDLLNEMDINCRQHSIYCDLTYCLRACLIVSSAIDSSTLLQIKLNTSMTCVGTAKNWECKEFKKYFTSVFSPIKTTIAKVPIAKLFVVSIILWDYIACLYGSQICFSFKLQPSTLKYDIAYTK